MDIQEIAFTIHSGDIKRYSRAGAAHQFLIYRESTTEETVFHNYEYKKNLFPFTNTAK